MLIKLENYESKRELVIDLDYCIGYRFDADDDTMILYTSYQKIKIVNHQPFYDNWSSFVKAVKEHFSYLIDKQPISAI